MLYGFKVPNFFFLSHVVMCFNHVVNFFYFCFVFKLFIFQCGIIPKDAKKENEEIGITATKLLK